MSTINALAVPSFAMSGDSSIATAARTGAWPTDGITTAPTMACAGAAHRLFALAQGVVALGSKRRTAKGSLSWRATDC